MRHLLPLLLLAACGGSDSKDSQPASTAPPHPFAGHPIVEAEFMNIAHRGGSLLAPEETMPAFDNAIAIGADMLEMDVWSTSDGVLVLMHDDVVDRTTDGTGAITTKTWAEVQALDAAYFFSEDGGATYPLRGTGVQVARLDEVLAAHPETTFSIEIKQREPSIVDPVLAVIDAAGVADRVVLGSFEAGPIEEVRTKRPEILTSMSATDGLTFFYTTDEDYVPPTYYLAAPTTLGDIVLDEATITKAHDLGIVVHVWTINDPAEMDAIIGWGADGIITDDPATLAAHRP